MSGTRRNSLARSMTRTRSIGARSDWETAGARTPGAPSTAGGDDDGDDGDDEVEVVHAREDGGLARRHQRDGRMPQGLKLWVPSVPVAPLGWPGHVPLGQAIAIATVPAPLIDATAAQR